MLTSHLDEGIRDWHHTSVSERRSSNSTCTSSLNWDDTVTWDEWVKMLHVSDRSNTWSTTSVRDGECLMEIEMTNISTDEAWRGETKLSIKVGTVHVDLTSILVDD